MKISQLLVMGILTVTVAEQRGLAVTETCTAQSCTLPTIDCGTNGANSSALAAALTTHPVDDTGTVIVPSALTINFTGTCIGSFVMGPDASGNAIAQQINLSGQANASGGEPTATLESNGSGAPILTVASVTGGVSGITFRGGNTIPATRSIGKVNLPVNGGGAIANFGYLTVSNCQFINNTTGSQTTTTTSGGTTTTTTLQGQGGAIFNARTGSCTGNFPGGSFDCNKSGSLSIKYSNFTGNTTSGGYGAVLYNEVPYVSTSEAQGCEIDHSSFSGNGGNAQSIIVNTTDPSNGSRGQMFVTSSSFFDTAPNIPEFYVNDGDLYLTNSTIAESSPNPVGYGIWITVNNSNATLTYSTVFNKLFGLINTGGTFNLSNSIVFGSHFSTILGSGISDCDFAKGTMNSDTNSITDVTTGSHPCGPDTTHPTQVTAAELDLGPFADYGGGITGVPLPVVPLNPSSIALFAGDPKVCASTQYTSYVASIDERGTQRPQLPPASLPYPIQTTNAALGYCDVGAYEIADDSISFSGQTTTFYGNPPFQIDATSSSNPSNNASTADIIYSTNTPSVCSVSGNTVTILGAGTCNVLASTANSNATIPPTAPPCATGLGCTSTSDCAGGDICNNNVCVVQGATCSDGTLDGDETDVDCGGSCPGCATGKACKVDTDCVAGDTCANNVCSAPTTCLTAPCAVDESCSATLACASGDTCVSGVCLSDETCTTVPPIPSFFGVSYAATNASGQPLPPGQAYTILPASLTITGPTVTMVYGSTTIPAIVPVYTGLEYSDKTTTTPPVCTATLNGAPITITSSTPAGTYPITCSGAADANYTITYAPGTFTVTPAPITITASNGATQTFGSLSTIVVTATGFSGFVNGQNQSVLSNLVCGYVNPLNNNQITAFSSSTPVGTYQTGCTATAANYTVLPPPSGCVFPSATPGCTFATVTTAAISITASSATMVYGGPVPTITPIYSGLPNDQLAPATPPTCTTTATSESHVSGNPYATTCSGAADPNFTFTYTPGTLIITPAPLTITAPSVAQPFGTVPKIIPIYTGFVNGDTATSLTTQPTCVTNTTATSSQAGNPYISSCSGAVDPDYTFTYVPGVVTVGIGMLNVVASSPTIVFGEPIPAITPVYVGLGSLPPSDVTTPTCTTTATASSGPGTYPTTCSGASIANFIITYTDGTLTIKQDPTITVVTTAPPQLAGQGSTVAVTVQVQSTYGTPTGQVNVTASTGETCQALLNHGTGTCTLSFATRELETITATYEGDQDFTGSTSGNVYLGVTQPTAPELQPISPGCNSTGGSGNVANLLPMLFAFAYLLTRRAMRKPAK